MDQSCTSLRASSPLLTPIPSTLAPSPRACWLISMHPMVYVYLRVYIDMDLSDAKTTYGYSALHTAIISRDVKTVQALTTATLSRDLDSRDSMGFTALHLATLQGNKELVQMLVQAGCDINSRTKVS